MADATIGTYHLADNPDLYELQRSNNFEFVVPNLGSLLRAGYSETDTNALINNAEEVLRISVVESSVPTFTQDVITIRRGNSVMKAAGVPSFNEGSLVINDYIGADGKSALMAWQNLSYNVDTEKVGSMANPNTQYKKNCYLIEYTPDYRKVRTWILYGCWISKLSEGAYSAEDGGKHAISATIEYDHAKIDLSDSM